MPRSVPAHAQPLEGEAALVRALGPFQLGASIINIIVGAGVFLLPALLFTRMGTSAPLAFLAGALVIVPVALCFAAVGSRAAATGGPYTYLSATFGPFAGFLGGALMWICNVASSAGVAAAFAGQLANAFPVLGAPGPRAVILVGTYGAIFALNAFGVRLGARAITTMAALKLAPLFLLVLVGAWFVDWTQVTWTSVPSLAALGSSMVLVMFAYSGIETALIPSGEVQDPSKQVPRATFGAVLVVVLLYIGLQIVNQGVLGPALGGSSAAIADTAGALWSPGRAVLLATACVSMAGFLLGNLFASSRLLFALGRDGYLPSAWGRVTATHHVPLVALATHAGIGLALALAGNFEALALISGGAICLVYLAVAIAAWKAQALDLRERGEPFRLPGGAVAVPLIAAVAMLAILCTLTRKEWSAIAVALVVLVGLYAVLRVLRSRQGRGT